MHGDGRRARDAQNLLISAGTHALCLFLLVGIPMCRSRAPRKPEHKIYTFTLIDPALLSMKTTTGGPTSATVKTQGQKIAIPKKEEPKKPPEKKPEKKDKAPEKKDKEKKADKKKPEEKKDKALFSKKTIEEKIKEQLDKIEEKKWVEPDKADDLLKPASREKIAEQGIAGLLNTGDFANVNYNDAVASLIYQTWQPPSKTAADQEGLTVVIRFRIMRDGTVVSPRVEKKSGSEVLDTSSLQALKDASPLPPLPEDCTGDSLEVCMTFVPVPEE